MVQRVVAASINGNGIGVDLLATDSVYVASNVLVSSTQDCAISGSGSSHRATIEGALFGIVGVCLGDQPLSDNNQRLYVGTHGTIFGLSVGAELCGGASIATNHGRIWGGSVGLKIGAGITGSSTVYNYGAIEADESAIARISAAETGTLIIFNYGTIRGTQNIMAASFANAIDKVINRGTMIGDLHLSLGNDIYDGRLGTIEGVIFGEENNDMFLPGLGIETIDGGTGADVLDFRTGGAVKLALDGAFENTGTAIDDTYINIEIVYGSLAGNDILRGNSLSNIFFGWGGNDWMAGGSGNDVLIGGDGIDQINGGLGDDSFVFTHLVQAGDLISDFSNSVGNNDRFQLTAAGFGGGLVAGALDPLKFQSRSDNLAQDQDDRFIFRTGDATLWFDSNGNLAGGLTLLADLQAGALLTATDIVLV
ncbi:MAG: calcium-binding protein [Paracoccaceae bacterium]